LAVINRHFCNSAASSTGIVNTEDVDRLIELIKVKRGHAEADGREAEERAAQMAEAKAAMRAAGDGS
jgi:hypothetical protein